MMIQKLTALSGLLVSAYCMVLHQAPLPLYQPFQYHLLPPNYKFAYEVNDLHTGDFKKQQESRRGGIVLGQYSLLQPDGVTRTVDYRAEDRTGFNAIVKNVGTPYNGLADIHEGGGKDNERQTDERPQGEQSWRSADDEQVTSVPLTITHTSVVHQTLRKWSSPFE